MPKGYRCSVAIAIAAWAFARVAPPANVFDKTSLAQALSEGSDQMR
jgi:hypothetical protein